MKRLTIAVAMALLCALALPVASQWQRVQIDGESVCERRTGETFNPTYEARSTVTLVCNVLNQFEQWVIGDAQAITVRFALTRNADGSFDTAFPAGDKGEADPVQPLSLNNPTALSATSVLITRASDCSDGTLPYNYELERGPDPANFAALADSATLFDSPGYNDTTVSASTTYYYRARCEDADTDLSAYSNVVSVTTPAESPADSTDPTTPANCAAVPASNTISTLGLNCDDSTDAVGVTGYNCTVGLGDGMGNPVSFISLHVSQTSSCLFTNLAESQEHYMRMSAFDAAGNTSAASARLYDTTATDTPTPEANIIFRETFEGFPIGAITTNTNWSTSQDPNGSVTIQNSNPVGTGFGKYLRPRLVRSGSDDFRAEIANRVAPGGTSGGQLNHVSPNAWSSIAHWYGFVVCIDQFDGTVGAHLNQWHEWGDGHWNPLISLFGNLSGLRVYMENNEENPFGGNPINTGPTVLSPVFYTPTVGQCFEVVYQLREDSRRSTEGGAGVLRIWVGHNLTGNSAPSWEWLNKANTHKTDALVNAQGFGHGGETIRPYNKIGGYMTGWVNSGVDGWVYSTRYDNYTAMDDTGSLAAMLVALADPD